MQNSTHFNSIKYMYKLLTICHGFFFKHFFQVQNTVALQIFGSTKAQLVSFHGKFHIRVLLQVLPPQSDK